MGRAAKDRLAFPLALAAATGLWLSGCGNHLAPDAQSNGPSSPSGGLDCDPNAVPFGGGSGSQSDPWRVCSRSHWGEMVSGPEPGKHFRLVGHLDFQGKAAPLADNFLGTFDGGGGRLENLSGSPLFVQLSGTFRNVELRNFSVVAGNNVGALAGVVTGKGVVEDVQASGDVVGSFNAGGLVGVNNGTLRRVDVAMDVQGNSRIGGLAGIQNGIVQSSFARGTVSGVQYVGGLAGSVGFSGQVEKVVVGPSTVSASSEAVGGIAGDTGPSTVLADVVALANVSGRTRVGGAVGLHAGTMSRILAVGTVTASVDTADALCGSDSGASMASYFDLTKSGLSTSACGQGKSTSALYQPATYTGWDVTTVWLVNGVAYPTLR